MSRRLAADKRPNGQTHHGSGSFAQGLASPRGCPRAPTRPDDDNIYPHPPVSPLHHRPGLPPLPEKKFVRKNVFIDSYYPVVQGDHTETSGGTRSSTCDRVQEEEVSTDRKTESSWETGSLEGYKNAEEAEAATDLSGHSATTLITVSPTVDSRTYTVLSCSSDIDSTFVNISQSPNDGASGITACDDRFAPSAVGCFNQLYHRIHNLEGLLRRAVVPSVRTKNMRCTKGVGGERDKPKEFFRVKNEAAGTGKTRESTCLYIPEVTDEKTSSDTDSELRNIKKRLRVLEKKLKMTKQPSLPLSFCRHRKSPESLPSSSLPFTDSGASPADNETTPSARSETESFLQSEGCVGARQQDPRDKKPKTKVRKKFISKCRGVRKKCSDLVSPSKKAPLKVSTTTGWSEVVYQHSVLTEESVTTALLNRSFSTLTKTDSSAFVYLRCQHEDLLEPPPKPRKKNAKRKYLSKKSSKTNILSFRRQKESALPIAHTYVFGDCSLPAANGPWKDGVGGDAPDWEPPDWISHRHNRRSGDWSGTLKPAKPPNVVPLDELKRGGRVKVPVLFEEVCKTPDSKKLAHKFSNVSMRFVVVEQDNSHPLTRLRKLINRLSQPKPPPKGEHYVFGVSKCGCDNSQVHALGPMSHRNVTRGFS